MRILKRLFSSRPEECEDSTDSHKVDGARPEINAPSDDVAKGGLAPIGTAEIVLHLRNDVDAVDRSSVEETRRTYVSKHGKGSVKQLEDICIDRSLDKAIRLKAVEYISETNDVFGEPIGFLQDHFIENKRPSELIKLASAGDRDAVADLALYRSAKKALERAGGAIGFADSGKAKKGLLDAAKSGDKVKMRDLLERGADPNWKSGHAPALELAIRNHNDAAALLLLEAGARAEGSFVEKNPEPIGKITYSLLMEAAIWCSFEVVESMLQNGADPNRVHSGWTVLTRVARRDWPKITQLLLDHGANPDFVLPNGQTALSIAREEKNLRTVEVLECWQACQ